MAIKPTPVPAEKSQTARESLGDELRRGLATAKELSQRVGLREKDVAEHLEHLAKSLKARGEKLVVEPATCIACGFQFKEREKLKKPGSCPQCGSSRIDPPAFSIAAT